MSAFYLDGRPAWIEETRAAGDRFGEHANLAAHTLLAGLRRVSP